MFIRNESKWGREKGKRFGSVSVLSLSFSAFCRF
eukprot:COSAG06_NODE_52267_length_306_cov_3.009662_2_plen_33_part_01